MALVQERIERLREELADVRALAECSPKSAFHFPTFARERDAALAEQEIKIAAKQLPLRREQKRLELVVIIGQQGGVFLLTNIVLKPFRQRNGFA